MYRATNGGMSFKGWIGEKILCLGMWLSLDRKIYRRIHNVVIPARDGTTQIDHVVISIYGIFVIETKNMAGWIYGQERDEKWCQMFPRQKYRFQNPLLQNFRHTICLAEFLEIPHDLLRSVVIFVGDCQFNTPMPANVLQGGLVSHMAQFQTPCISPETVKLIHEKLLGLNKSRITLSVHLQSLRQRHNSPTTCPKCGQPLMKRIAKQGRNAGNEFLGCSSYPKCRYVRDLGPQKRIQPPPLITAR
jgi:hypothetical protein